ncbi:asparagine synthase (glutamine-hydrolyzing) [Patulibacter sp. SYSU D01012]|uniref:asparagine synthase (glutamine-hydrolyzing) n=1 Tax=Patulibacter sp. SYSU D01012 TaxID=2817381 RepID=UPI001B309DC8
MCGICGFVSPDHVELDRAAGRRMCETIEHRGPDGHGEVAVSGAGRLHGWIGHRRLRIVDLSEAAHQPMEGEDGAVVLTYNGEIYNFEALRDELRRAGATFRSHGDTEVVLRAYETWGDAFVERLDGMFALAVWDARRGRLLLARDRTGKKPLFYSTAGGRLTFASEIKALLTCPWVPGEVDPEAIPEFLTYGYVPHPRTSYRDVVQVPPASVVVYDDDGLHAPRAYWSAVPAHGTDLRVGPPVLERIAGLLEDATKRRMVADVPLGALLSGGIDSSLVVGLMTRHAQEPVHTFSIGFPEEPSYDERSHARLVAEHFGTRHTEHAVRMDAVALVDRLLWHHDQPFADSSAIPTFVVAQLARRDVKVVLNGDGGDEVFGGYHRFRAAAVSRFLPRAVARAGRPVAGLLPRGDGYGDLGRRAQRFLERAEGTVLDRYQSWIAVAGEELLPSLLSPDLRALAVRSHLRRSMDAAYADADGLPDLDRILYANLRTYLPDDLSVKVDRTTMAHGLEARSPFLDTALIDYVARLPARQKVGLRHVKPVLRRAFGPLLPPQIWDRSKQGFGVPMHRWFREELGTMFADEVLASDARTAAYLDRAAVGRLLTDHRERHADHGARLWTILVLERWLRRTERPVETRPPGGDAVLDITPAS